MFLADTGIPLIFVGIRAMALALPIVIIIEALYCSRILKTKIGITFVAATVANVISTLVGLPLYSFRVYTSHGAPMLDPEGHEFFPYPNENWKFSAAILLLLIPTFFVSVFIERWIYQWILKKRTEETRFLRMSWLIHLASYTFLVLAGLGALFYSLSAE